MAREWDGNGTGEETEEEKVVAKRTPTVDPHEPPVWRTTCQSFDCLCPNFWFIVGGAFATDFHSLDRIFGMRFVAL